MNKDIEKILEENLKLKAKIKDLSKQKKFGIVWEDIEEDLEHDINDVVPFLVSKHDKEKIDTGTLSLNNNYLIEGENLFSLEILLATHKGKIDLIYIDPPYNSPNSRTIYKNKFGSKDDLYKHSEFLSMINKRIKLARELLSDDGVIFLTIDDYEISVLRPLMDEIFGEDNRLSQLTIVHNEGGRDDHDFFAPTHEYALVYAKDIKKCSTASINLTEEEEEKYPLEDNISFYKPAPFSRSGRNSTVAERPNMFYPIYYSSQENKLSLSKENKEFIKILPPKNNNEEQSVWRWGKETFLKSKDTELFVEKKNNEYVIKIKNRLSSNKGKKPKTVWSGPQYNAATHGTKLVDSILNSRGDFDYPKSLYAVIESLLIGLGNKKNGIILDFYAGSGTTGHALLDINFQKGTEHKFILCTNNENKISENITFQRLKNVINGYKSKDGSKIAGINGNLKYLKVDFFKKKDPNYFQDEEKIALSENLGYVLALKEDTPNLVKKNKFFQIYKSLGKICALYFNEDTSRISDLVVELDAYKEEKIIYVFSWTANSYTTHELNQKNILVRDLPESILKNHFNFLQICN